MVENTYKYIVLVLQVRLFSLTYCGILSVLQDHKEKGNRVKTSEI